MKMMKDIFEMTIILAILIGGVFAGLVDVGVPVNVGIMLIGAASPIAAVGISAHLGNM